MYVSVERGRATPPVGKDIVLTASIELNVMRSTHVVHVQVGDCVVTSTNIDQHTIPRCNGITELKTTQRVVVRGDGNVYTILSLWHPDHTTR